MIRDLQYTDCIDPHQSVLEKQSVLDDIATTAALADLFGITARTLRELTKMASSCAPGAVTAMSASGT